MVLEAGCTSLSCNLGASSRDLSSWASLDLPTAWRSEGCQTAYRAAPQENKSKVFSIF